MERSLIIVKPDAVQRGLIGEVLRRLEQRGLRFVGLKLMWVDRELAERHYAEHRGKPFFEELLSFITSGPVVVGVVEGPRAIEVTRKTMGKTDPAQAEPGTIRGDRSRSRRTSFTGRTARRRRHTRSVCSSGKTSW